MALGENTQERWPARWAERFERVLPYGAAEREDALAWQVALHAAGSFAFELYPDITRALNRTESPIERALLAATLVEWSYNAALWLWCGPADRSGPRRYPRRFWTFPACRPSTCAHRQHPPDPLFEGPWSPMPSPRVVLYPQLKLGPYRADMFAVVDRPATRSQPASRRTMVIECDGHDFHEKTKEQASADKARDRYLQTRGHLVFRFSGSDIWRRPILCAREALAALTGAESA